MNIIKIVALLSWYSGYAFAATDGGSGIIHGSNHAYSLTAPAGWLLDTQVGVSQGIHAAFYPKGSSWEKGDAVMYSRARTKGGNVNTIDEMVKDTIGEFHNNGSLKYIGKEASAILASNKRSARVFYYSGDKWGNYEAVAYFDEKKTINFIVLNSRTLKDFKNSLPAFEPLVRSYLFLADEITHQNKKG